MADKKFEKKPVDRGVVDSIYALRLRRYNEKGAGAKVKRPAIPARPAVLTKLRSAVAAVAKAPKKKTKKRRARR